MEEAGLTWWPVWLRDRALSHSAASTLPFDLFLNNHVYLSGCPPPPALHFPLPSIFFYIFQIQTFQKLAKFPSIRGSTYTLHLTFWCHQGAVDLLAICELTSSTHASCLFPLITVEERADFFLSEPLVQDSPWAVNLWMAHKAWWPRPGCWS